METDTPHMGMAWYEYEISRFVEVRMIIKTKVKVSKTKFKTMNFMESLFSKNIKRKKYAGLKWNSEIYGPLFLLKLRNMIICLR